MVDLILVFFSLSVQQAHWPPVALHRTFSLFKYCETYGDKKIKLKQIFHHWFHFSWRTTWWGGATSWWRVYSSCHAISKAIRLMGLIQWKGVETKQEQYPCFRMYNVHKCVISLIFRCWTHNFKNTNTHIHVCVVFANRCVSCLFIIGEFPKKFGLECSISKSY